MAYGPCLYSFQNVSHFSCLFLLDIPYDRKKKTLRLRSSVRIVISNITGAKFDPNTEGRVGKLIIVEKLKLLFFFNQDLDM